MCSARCCRWCRCTLASHGRCISSQRTASATAGRVRPKRGPRCPDPKLLSLADVKGRACRQLLLLAHKMLVASDACGRRLAVHAFCVLLRRRLLPSEDAACDAVVALRSSATAAVAGQPHLYSELRHVLLSHQPSQPAARSLLLHALVAHLRNAAPPPPPPTADDSTTSVAATNGHTAHGQPVRGKVARRASTPSPSPTPLSEAHHRHRHVDAPMDGAWAARLLSLARLPEAEMRCAAAGALLRCALVALRAAAPGGTAAGGAAAGRAAEECGGLRQLEAAVQALRAAMLSGAEGGAEIDVAISRATTGSAAAAAAGGSAVVTGGSAAGSGAAAMQAVCYLALPMAEEMLLELGQQGGCQVGGSGSGGSTGEGAAPLRHEANGDGGGDVGRQAVAAFRGAVLLCSRHGVRPSLATAVARLLAALPVGSAAAREGPELVDANRSTGRGLALAMAFAPALHALLAAGAVLRAAAAPPHAEGPAGAPPLGATGQMPPGGAAQGGPPTAASLGGAALLCACGLAGVGAALQVVRPRRQEPATSSPLY